MAPKISSKSDIFQDEGDTGKNYTGIKSPSLLGAGRPVRYGFVLSQKSYVQSQVILTLNPQSITQEEPAATNITYTQNAGKFIERHGQISKTITIQGTTGYTPSTSPLLPMGGGALRNNIPGSVVVDALGPVSGMAEFLKLRKLFRTYWRNFSDDAFVNERSNAFMYFLNEKDDESWLVEPTSFSMSRSSPGNKFTYSYSITLQTIAPVEALTFDEDPLTTFQKLLNAKATLSAIATNATNTVALLGDTIANVSGAIRDAITSVSAVLTGIAGGLNAIADGSKEIVDLGSFIKGNADNIVGSFQGAWQNLLSVGDNQASSTVFGANPISFEVHKALASAAVDVATLASRQELFSAAFPYTWNQVLQNYDPNYGVGSFNSALTDPLQRNGVQETSILPYDTLQTIAVRELGNAERAMELAILNKLKPPYISPSSVERSPNTLAPGDRLLIPALASNKDASRAPVRSTIYTDPNFNGLLVAYSGPNRFQVNTQGADFRINQWAGFTLTMPDLLASAGAYEPPFGTPETTQADNMVTAVNLLPRNIRTCGDDLGNATGFVQRAIGGYDLAASLGDWFSASTADQWEESYSILGAPPSAGDCLSVFFAVVPNATYTWTFYLKAPAGVVSHFNAMYDDLGGNAFSSNTDDLTSWTRITQTITIDPGSTMLQLQVAVNTPVWYTDGWQLELGGSATPWVDPGSQNLLPIPDADYATFAAFVGGYLVLDPGGLTQELVLISSTPGPDYLTISTPAFSHGPGTSIIYAGTMPVIPPNSAAGTGAPFSAIVVSNTNNTLTVDTTPTSSPTVGDIVRLALVRSQSVVPRKSAQEQLLGVDVRLNSANDLVVDASGRLDVIDSTNNMNQAVMIKTKTTKGDLAAHPNFGIDFYPGQRVSPDALFAYRVSIKQTLLSDNRIESVEQLTLSITGDKLNLTAYLVLAGRAQPYALDTRGAT